MYLLTETAMGDSNNFEILSFEEVENLKKERTLLSNRIEGTKRKLALETKLRDAAQSIGRLYSPPSPRSSGEYGANGTKSHRRSRSIFGRNGAAEVLDKSDSELAMSQRKCEELAQELWKLERKSQQINQRLLEHTAGVLQLTHKGLKKAPKNAEARGSASLYDGHEFDDRSLYRTPEHLDNYGLHGRVEMDGPVVSTEAMQATQRRLEDLSQHICNMMIQASPDEFVDPPPQPSYGSGSAGSTAAMEMHLAYLENGLNSLSSRQAPAVAAEAPAPHIEGAWKEQLTEVNNQVQAIVDRFGLTRSPTLPPPPGASDGEGLEEQLSYLHTGIDGLASRVDGLLEQKSILTTQIQQQRELNSKSDAERDAHIADLTEQLAHARRDLEQRSDRGVDSSDAERDAYIADLTEQLAEARKEIAHLSEREAERELDSHSAAEKDAYIADLTEQLTHARKELAVLSERDAERELDSHTIVEKEALIADLTEQLNHARGELEHSEREGKAARDELTVVMEQLEEMRHNGTSQEDAKAALVQAEGEIARLQSVVESLQGEADSRAEEMREARDRAEQEVAHLEASIQQIRSESDERVKEAIDQRAQAEETANRLQNEMTELEGEVVRITTELTMVKAELDGAYGTRAQRAAEVAANPEIQKELDALNTRNIELAEELAALKSQKGQQGGGDLQQRADTLEKELRETLEDYEVMTKASIEFEKERERFEGMIDNLRDRCEQLEQQLSEERINWMNLNSPTSMGRDPTSETTSTMVLKNEFKKMMRDTRNENMKILKVSLQGLCPEALQNILTKPTGRTGGAEEDRRTSSGSAKRARTSHWQAYAQSSRHSIMMMTMFYVGFDCILSLGLVVHIDHHLLYTNSMSARQVRRCHFPTSSFTFMLVSSQTSPGTYLHSLNALCYYSHHDSRS